MNIVIAVILFIFNCGPLVFSENRRFVAKLAELQSGAEPEQENFASKVTRRLSLHAKSHTGRSTSVSGSKLRSGSMSRMNERTGSINYARITGGRMNFLES